MVDSDMDAAEITSNLARLATRGAAWLRAKAPHWGDSILCDGLIYAARVLGQPSPDAGSPVSDAIAWFAPKLAAGPRTDGWIWFWSAEALPALDLYELTGNATYLDHARKVVRALETAATHTPDGAIVPHPPALEVWVDITYFSAPAMARLARITSDPPLIDRALDQLIVHQRHLADPETGLFWHVGFVDKRRHSPCLWARGNSWFSIAATEAIQEIRAAGLQDRFASKIDLIAGALARQLGAVIKLQDSGGLWHTVIDRPESYLESSAAAGFALAIGRALTLGLAGLDSRCARDCYDRALDAIVAKITTGGDFIGVSQQTPPGDFNFYNSIETGTAPFGTGVCLMALAEKLRTSS